MATHNATRVGNYRAGSSRNEFFVYGGADAAPNKVLEFAIDGRYFFLCKAIMLVNYVSPTATVMPQNFNVRIYDDERSRYFQDQPLANVTVGGNAGSPNILPAPILFHPKNLIRLELDRVVTRVRWAFIGEHITNPDPAWVERMSRRYWFQASVLGLPQTGITELDIRDGEYDFVIFRALSKNTTDGVLSNANPGLMGIREKGPQGAAWSNIDVPNLNYGGAFADSAGPRLFLPPRVLPLPTTLKIQTTVIPNSAYIDQVFDGMKYPKGTKWEEWV